MDMIVIMMKNMMIIIIQLMIAIQLMMKNLKKQENAYK